MDIFSAELAALIGSRVKPADGAAGGLKKNSTEALSHDISRILAEALQRLGLTDVRAPVGGRDRSFMGGYGTKGVDVYLSDEKHGRLPTDAPELYEAIGIRLFDPGNPDSLDLAPEGVPASLHAATYPQRLVDAFNRRNPFY